MSKKKKKLSQAEKGSMFMDLGAEVVRYETNGGLVVAFPSIDSTMLCLYFTKEGNVYRWLDSSKRDVILKLK